MKLDRETTEKVAEFFGGTIGKESFALVLRKFVYEAIALTLAADDNKWTPEKETITAGHFWIHEFCEILDPQLTKED